MLLEKVSSPKDIKKFSMEELRILCAEIREYIIRCCSENPGHLASSLGAVELIVGLHYAYDAPKDKIVFDVGHQAYAHKIICGRREAFKGNRTKDGISGFPSMAESEFDAFGAGHASTSISALLGLEKAAKLQGIDSKAVALIGDGALTGGLAFEGLNNAGDSDILIVINDNDQSIDKNLGSFHEHLLRLTTSRRYNSLKSHIWQGVGEGWLRDKISKLTKEVKSHFVRDFGGAVFESLGFRYFGPIDGNDVEIVASVLPKLRDIPGPKVLHAHTVKGKGYAPAEANPTLWHSPGKFNPGTGLCVCSSCPAADKYQDVFGQTLLQLALSDKRVVGITPAMATGCGMTLLAEKMPERFFDVGIEEEHAVTFSAGLAAGGMRPFCNIYSSFAQRSYDQIIHDVALQKLPVVLCLDRAGLVGEDGATHQGSFDLAALRCIPNVVISSPKDEIELVNLMHTALAWEDGPFVIRYPRGCGEGVQWKGKEPEILPVGKAEQLMEGSHIAVLGLGHVSNRAVEAAKAFHKERTWNPAVYNVRFLKPLDEELIEKIFANYSRILTVEDGSLKGGLYSAIAELSVLKGYPGRIAGLGIPDEFILQDSQESQRKSCGIDTQGITAKLFEMALDDPLRAPEK